jgi:predicted nucleic acid-binding protein
VRYWDASALVPLLVKEDGTTLCRAWLKEDPVVATWALTLIELQSAVERRAREAAITGRQRDRLLGLVDSISDAWDEVTDVLSVRAHASTLLARHPLRAADALQLGAASVLSGAEPASVAFVCLDRNLAEAAKKEGFQVLTWPD